MKMKKIGLMLLMACVTFFAACSDDDEPVVKDDHAAAVAGTYNGEIMVALADFDSESVGKKDITITKSGENKVNLELKDFKFGEGEAVIPVGDIKIPNVEIKKSNNGYTMVSKTETLDLAGGTLKDTKITITSGTFIDNKMSVKLDIKAGPLDVYVTIDNAAKK